MAWVALGCVAVQWLAFVPAWWTASERTYDLVGSATFVGAVAVAAWGAAGTQGLRFRGALAAGLVMIWALRLGLFLFARVLRAGHDRRFGEIRRSGPRFLVAWSLQGLWVCWTSLPAWIAICRPTPDRLLATDFLGLSLWSLGFALEVVADAQKGAFRRVPANRERWIETGVWAWSRHPNYLGEIVLWLGMTVLASPGFSGPAWAGILSPALVALLLTRGSGIPILEADADRRWGSDPAYQAYVARTPVLVPWPGRSTGAG